MGLFEIPESLTLTIVFAALSGVFLTLATGATHLPAHIDRMVDELESDDATGIESFTDDNNNAAATNDSICTRPKKVTKKMWRVAYGVNLLFAAIGGTLNLVGTWFGPVSLFAPIKQVSQIISGMILFSYILRTESKPNKDTSVGNYIIMLSSIMLIFVGPKIQEDPIKARDLFTEERSLICVFVILAVGFFFAFPYQFILGCTHAPTTDRVSFVCLLITEVIHAVIGNSCSKLFPILTGNLFIYNAIILVLAIFTITYSSVLRSTVILCQTEYLPLMLSANIFMNGLVGLLVWEDSIINIGGYIVLYFFFLMGVYLVSDYEILPGTFFKDQTNSAQSNLIEGLVHGRARTLYSHRESRIFWLNEAQKKREEGEGEATCDASSHKTKSHDNLEEISLDSKALSDAVEQDFGNNETINSEASC